MTTLADPQPVRQSAAIPANPARVRDIRLDFFRGLAMFIIMISCCI